MYQLHILIDLMLGGLKKYIFKNKNEVFFHSFHSFTAKLSLSDTQSCVLHLQQLCLLSPSQSLSFTLPRNMAPSAFENSGTWITIGLNF